MTLLGAIVSYLKIKPLAFNAPNAKLLWWQHVILWLGLLLLLAILYFFVTIGIDYQDSGVWATIFFISWLLVSVVSSHKPKIIGLIVMFLLTLIYCSVALSFYFQDRLLLNSVYHLVAFWIAYLLAHRLVSWWYKDIRDPFARL
ncbi:membrane protein [Beggiatoa sp. PS]|nr:membrane protein [Beggiatoa sp. PS]